jgi:hypothetical protein
VAWCLAAAVGADEVQAEPAGDQVLEVAAGEALVADEGQPGPQGVIAARVRQQRGGYLAFPDFRAGQAPGDGHPVRRGEQVELLNIPRVPWPSGWCLRSG